MEDEIIFDESRMSTKKKVILLILFFIIIIAIILFVFNSYNFKVNKTITYELGDELSLDVKDYITNKPFNTDGYKLNLDGVPHTDDNKLTTAGEYTFKVSLNDTTKEGKIIIKDTKAPTVETIDLTVGTNDEVLAEDFVIKCQDASLPCTYTLDGKYDKSAGTYNLVLIVKDQENNETKQDVKLTVKENYSLDEEKVNDIEVKYLEPDYGDWDGEFVISFSGGFDPEDEESYRWTYFYDFLNSNYNDYLPPKYENKTVKDAEIIAVYNKYHYIIGFAARATLNDGTITYLTNGE